MKMRALLLIIISILFISFSSSQADGKKDINDVYVIIFITDGLTYSKFRDTLDKGILPNIEKFFIRDGATFKNVFTVFPSASATAYQAFASGLFPGHSGMVYLEWFDRTKRKPINYFTLTGHKHVDIDFLNYRALIDPEIEDLYPETTIYEHLRDYKTASIYSSFSAKATYTKPRIPIPAFWSVFGSKRDEMIDKYAFNEVIKLFEKPIKKIPRFTFVGLYTFDLFGHHFGAESRMLEFNLEIFDKRIGTFIDLLKERNIFDKTYIIIASDHGMHTTPKSKFDLKKVIKESKLTAYSETRNHDKFNIYVSSRGIASAHLYLKGKDSWKERPSHEMLRNYPVDNNKSINVIDILRKLSEIKFVIARNGFYKVDIFSKRGHARIEKKIDNKSFFYKYTVIDGDDPFELNKDFNNNRFYDVETWGCRTKNSKYPDAIVQLGQIFDDNRSGDIFLIAEDDWVFYRHKSGTHGSIMRQDMQIPLMIRGPDIEPFQYDFARVVDVYPEILRWFGINIDDKDFDSVSLFNSNRCTKTSKGINNFRASHTEKLRLKKKLKTILSNLEKGNNESVPQELFQYTKWMLQQELKRLDQ